MYFFFGMLCSIDAVRLPDWRKALQELAFVKIESQSFYKGFIESHNYRRDDEAKA
jgi:hypothetical protein